MGKAHRGCVRHRHRWWHLAPALFVALLVTACSPGAGEQESSPPATGTTGAAASPTATTPSPTGSPTPTQTITTKPLRDTGGGQLTLELYALERRDGLVVLDFGVRNGTDEGFGLRNAFSESGTTDDVGGVYLHDVGGKTKYYPAKADGECVCSTELRGFQVSPGSALSLTATYGKLPDGVDEVDVYVPSVGILADVPVTG